jgi:hypothetical protein
LRLYRVPDTSLHPSRRLTGTAVGLAAAVLGVACAREEPPPGSHPDRVPPSVREFNPVRNSIVPGFGGSAEIRFDEPITGVTNLQQTLIASPADRYQVSSGFSNIKISPTDDWADGVVYYFQIPEGIADLLGNRTVEPIELVFSTGPELSATRVTGEVRQRVNGEALSPGRVLFYNLAGDSIPYGALTDRQGEFELPYLPPDDYWSFAFQDLNNNLRLERLFEPYDSVRLELEPVGFAVLSFRVVEPDTTPPVLGLIQDADNLALELKFDDYLDPEQDFTAAGLTIRQTESGQRWEIEEVRLEVEAPRGRGRGGARTPAETSRAQPAAEPAPPDTAATEPVPPDTAAAGEEEPSPDDAAVEADSLLDGAPEVETPLAGGGEADTPAEEAAPEAAAPRPSLQEEPPAQEADTLPEEKLPSQTLRIQLGTPLESGTYHLVLDRIVNLRLLEAAVDTTFSYPLEVEEEEQGGPAEEDQGDPAGDPAGEPEEGPDEGPDGGDEGASP